MTGFRTKLPTIALLSLLISPVMMSCGNVDSGDEAVEDQGGEFNTEETEAPQNQSVEAEEEETNETEND